VKNPEPSPVAGKTNICDDMRTLIESIKQAAPFDALETDLYT